MAVVGAAEGVRQRGACIASPGGIWPVRPCWAWPAAQGLGLGTLAVACREEALPCPASHSGRYPSSKGFDWAAPRPCRCPPKAEAWHPAARPPPPPPSPCQVVQEGAVAVVSQRDVEGVRLRDHGREDDDTGQGSARERVGAARPTQALRPGGRRRHTQSDQRRTKAKTSMLDPEESWIHGSCVAGRTSHVGRGVSSVPTLHACTPPNKGVPAAPLQAPGTRLRGPGGGWRRRR